MKVSYKTSTQSLMDNGGILKIADSPIHGVGIFTKVHVMKFAKLGVGIRYILGVLPYVTPFPGQYINHSWKPNCILQYNAEEWTYDLISCRDIEAGEEVTMDYQNTPWYIFGPEDDWQ